MSNGPVRGGAWSGDGQILVASDAGLSRVPASGGPATSLIVTSPSVVNGVVWPQLLPGGRFLYRINSGKNTGTFAATVANPTEAVRLPVTTDTNVLYAPSGDGRGHLLWLDRGGALVAQEFDSATFRVVGEPHPLADPVAKLETIGRMNVAVSDSGVLLYNASGNDSQFKWFDRAGRSLGVVTSPRC